DAVFGHSEVYQQHQPLPAARAQRHGLKPKSTSRCQPDIAVNPASEMPDAGWLVGVEIGAAADGDSWHDEPDEVEICPSVALGQRVGRLQGKGRLCHCTAGHAHKEHEQDWK